MVLMKLERKEMKPLLLDAAFTGKHIQNRDAVFLFNWFWRDVFSATYGHVMTFWHDI